MQQLQRMRLRDTRKQIKSHNQTELHFQYNHQTARYGKNIEDDVLINE